MLENQGLLAIAFFEATALIILLVLFLLFRRDHPSSYFRLWLAGWICLTLSSLSELVLVVRDTPQLWLAVLVAREAAVLVFLLSVMQYTMGTGRRQRPLLPLIGVILATMYYIEHTSTRAVWIGALGDDRTGIHRTVVDRVDPLARRCHAQRARGVAAGRGFLGQRVARNGPPGMAASSGIPAARGL